MPQVSIMMGSDSDLPVMRSAAETLDHFGLKYDVKILSAHRTPQETMDYVIRATKKGVKVFIAGAGGAAHLPGVVASHTTMPVIGVPVKGTFEGLDALFSIVQMPPGIPVATVGVNAAKNAALLAVAILATSNGRLSKKLAGYRSAMKKEVLARSKKAELLGYKKYIEIMKK